MNSKIWWTSLEGHFHASHSSESNHWMDLIRNHFDDFQHGFNSWIFHCLQIPIYYLHLLNRNFVKESLLVFLIWIHTNHLSFFCQVRIFCFRFLFIIHVIDFHFNLLFDLPDHHLLSGFPKIPRNINFWIHLTMLETFKFKSHSKRDLNDPKTLPAHPLFLLRNQINSIRLLPILHQ